MLFSCLYERPWWTEWKVQPAYCENLCTWAENEGIFINSLTWVCWGRKHPYLPFQELINELSEIQVLIYRLNWCVCVSLIRTRTHDSKTLILYVHVYTLYGLKRTSPSGPPCRARVINAKYKSNGGAYIHIRKLARIKKNAIARLFCGLSGHSYHTYGSTFPLRLHEECPLFLCHKYSV